MYALVLSDIHANMPALEAEEFLANLHRGISTPAMFANSNVPPEVEFAASRGLKLVPVQGQSRFASAVRTRFRCPTSDLVQLRTFVADNPAAAPLNWVMAADGVIVLEYIPAIGRHFLNELCDGDWDGWSETLQFRAGSSSNATRFLLFRHDEQQLRILGPHFAGLHVYSSGALIPVPPSRFLSGTQLAWSNAAAIQVIPWFLLDHGSDGEWNPPAADPAIPPYAGDQCERRYVYDYSF